MHVPAICSARYTVLSVGRMAEMGSPVSDPFPLAIYSISLRLAMKAAYWDPSVIPEDWHMYFRCVFADQGRVKCTRMYIAVGTEAVEGKDAVDTVKEVYNQSVRWQWGATDVGYLLVQSLARWDVPLRQRLSLLFTAYDHHLLVIVIAVVLATAPLLYGNIPVAVGILKLTNTAISLKDVMITTWAVHFLLHFPMLCYADHAMRRTVLYDRLYFDCNEGAWSSGPRRWLCLLLFPLADIFLFLIPTLHAHAKMFISSSFNYVPSAKMGARGCPGACLPSRSDEEEYEVIPDLRV
jgi:cellulose synthase/poly-beta-1,6-N-acetylglucosamine synthase-like glycosyltransferase